jgi:hypothetical protein
VTGDPCGAVVGDPVAVTGDCDNGDGAVTGDPCGAVVGDPVAVTGDCDKGDGAVTGDLDDGMAQ